MCASTLLWENLKLKGGASIVRHRLGPREPRKPFIHFSLGKAGPFTLEIHIHFKSVKCKAHQIMRCRIKPCFKTAPKQFFEGVPHEWLRSSIVGLIPMGLLWDFYWDSYGISMTFLWEFYNVSKGFLCNFFGSSMIFLNRILCIFCGISMQFLFLSYGISMVMIFLWDSCEISMGSLWYF